MRASSAACTRFARHFAARNAGECHDPLTRESMPCPWQTQLGYVPLASMMCVRTVSVRICDRDMVQTTSIRVRLVFAQRYSPINGHSEMQAFTCQQHCAAT